MIDILPKFVVLLLLGACDENPCRFEAGLLPGGYIESGTCNTNFSCSAVRYVTKVVLHTCFGSDLFDDFSHIGCACQ